MRINQTDTNKYRLGDMFRRIAIWLFDCEEIVFYEVRTVITTFVDGSEIETRICFGVFPSYEAAMAKCAEAGKFIKANPAGVTSTVKTTIQERVKIERVRWD